MLIQFTPVSGLSAAHTVYLNGGNVVLLDKNSTCQPFPPNVSHLTLPIFNHPPCQAHPLTFSLSRRLLRRQLDQGDLGHQRRSDAHPGRHQDRRQRQAVLRRHAEVGARQGQARPHQGPDLQVCVGRRVAAGCLQFGPYSRFTARVSFYIRGCFVWPSLPPLLAANLGVEEWAVSCCRRNHLIRC